MNAWGEAAFAPRRIALVGASGEAGKAGRLLMDNLLAGGAREVLPIHPSATEILGRAAYPSVAAAPGPIDLAVIVTPAHTTVQVIEDCARAKVPVALILSGGFAETGPEGVALEAELKRAARAGGVRLIGPNCFGLIDVQRGLNASLAMGLPRPAASCCSPKAAPTAWPRFRARKTARSALPRCWRLATRPMCPRSMRCASSVPTRPRG